MPHISCRELLDSLGDLADGSLDRQAVLSIERHLGACHPCAVYARSYADVTEAGRVALTAADIPQKQAEAIVDEVMARVLGELGGATGAEDGDGPAVSDG